MTLMAERSENGAPFDTGVRLLAPDGTLVDDPRFTVRADSRQTESFYREMVRARRLDEEATALQRQGELVLWIPLRGQEAAQVGSAAAAEPGDFLFPSYREHAVVWHRGIPPVEVLRLLRGVTHGGWDPEAYNVANYVLVLASQTLHAVGYGLGVRLDGAAGQVVMVYLGDGAMSQGDANEAFVWAASFGAPVVFFCQNNQWAISTPSARQSPVPLARRAAGFGFPGVRVDGNDVLAVHAVTTWALEHARSGQGPVLIEANTYRMAPHTTSDDASRYQEAAEVAAWRARDPIDRVALLLGHTHDPAWFEGVRAEAEEAAATLRRECLALPDPAPRTLVDHVLVGGSALLREQRGEIWEG
ncbi:MULTISPECIES: thiamine pyrophosphate-dependent enzyme [unclassified Parafrankia]|uniref:2-oxoisovalerate dehydrogenase subunit alpha n=1 Tax=Parafrankia soli TaxID=2599596 RepID=A0A1S1PYF1_9ACTN|nr:pyruvate dehydrogenase [Parafrankia soli]TCJ33863.1 thiamine pyrophosphate-dependent dehydrogenase E1 component subunit alpha [Parafrankia sp. BMG5.11]SQD99101.1 3-methyl-2-oxobutanoate dehydrogenase subunit alpha [Parafrankia sp. Ea1.12]